MATSTETAQLLLDRLGNGPFRVRRMFGEYCVYRGDTAVALLCDDTLFVKDTAAGRARIECVMPIELGAPYPSAKAHIRITPDAWDDADWLRGVIDATADALPPPRSRKHARRVKPSADT